MGWHKKMPRKRLMLPLLIGVIVAGVLAFGGLSVLAAGGLGLGGSIIPTKPGTVITTPEKYNDNDYQKLVAFAQQGNNLAKLGWSLDYPDTWTGITWIGTTEIRVKAINIPGKELEGSLDVSGFQALTSIYCPGNSLSSLNAAGCTALTSLMCERNNLGSIDVRGCTELTQFTCDQNNLKSLDVSNCSKLDILDCKDNSLTSLKLGRCKEWAQFVCSGNRLTSLDLSKCTNLGALHCKDNRLKSLDLSNLSKLYLLQCGNNELTSLDLSGCSNLKSIECINNELSSLDVSDCRELQSVYCEENPELELIWGLGSAMSNTGFNSVVADLSDEVLLGNEQAVRDVIDKIDALPALAQLDLSDEGPVSAAGDAYNALSNVQKAFVSNHKKLAAAMNRIAEIKSADTGEGSGSIEEPGIGEMEVPGTGIPAGSGSTTIKLTIDQTHYFVNDQARLMDAAPVIIENRTMLPVRSVVEDLGGEVGWDPDERKATAALGGKTVSVWVGSAMAEANGRMVQIDPDNPSVMPIIVPPGRTLLPLRFITESLGCSVEWDQSTRTVTILYPGN